ncbi:helix-turn-helix domain-containing protein [uncultured Pseudoteredinibacter sp.]|uniref:helix-turn-helix domain-containing protein n=1 Tax=uncultured Pseudoteredinibacter sp. TaxID=1641701 RepID=UPI0034167C84
MATNYLTVEQVSKKLHVTAGTIRNRISKGDPMPPSIKVGRRRLFPEDEFESWIKLRRCI